MIDNVISAYEAVKMNGVSQGIIALCSFIAVIIVIQKFVTAWKEAFSEGDKPVDMKQFFKLFYIYIYVFAIIMVAPFAFTIVETALGNLQNELISHYQEDVDLSIDEAIVTFTKDYIEDVQRRHNWVGQQIQEVIMLPFNIAAYTILLYATKYIFFFFASARYLYLILLEIVTPIAVILYMDEKTRHYTHAYLKNLFVCYMTIPAFLIANALGSIIAENIMHMCGQNKYTMLGLLFAFVFKLFLFAKSVKFCRELLAVSSAGAQIRPVESLPIAVNYSKTIHLVFPSAVKYNQAVTDFVAVDNPESVPNILRIKANRKSFSKQTTVSVATEGGFFYSFNVTYADSLEHTNYFLPDMSSIRPDTIYLNEVSQTHLIAPEKVIYIDYGDTCIQVSKAENTENIVRMIAATGKVEEFPRQTNVSLATEGGKFYTFNVDYRQQPEAFVYEIGEKRPEKKANVILTDNIIPAGERDQVMSRVYNAKRGIFNKGIVRNKIVFSVNNLHIYDNLLLFTFEIENKSKLPYDIDYIRYYIIDKKTAKLTASQEVDQQALFSENYSPRIEGNGRMKYVIAFDKFTIPDEKVFRIEINEKNGGRHVLFDLENSDIVNVEDI